MEIAHALRHANVRHQREISGEAVFLTDEQPVELTHAVAIDDHVWIRPVHHCECRRHDGLSRVGHAAATGRVHVLNDRHTREEAHQREATWLGISVDIGRPRFFGSVWQCVENAVAMDCNKKTQKTT
ncbi:hypothetical protein [Paraburkholderia youngii]|uniref:hypothetical protein n=1 Tax=Paraburkholderia youngii TaxID=2782701 RepID=UPI003D1C624C